ncbi:alkylated DNA repair protein alkB like protein 4 [Strigomonas culicis]|nr:alkylated DNA repair protein alkB like protein 4 [Strigomonas culicis]|eukprot:EPY28430.1 alkylated DNA repair protein alkB like protein 4 [Strigomonas culicis]
MVKGLFVERDVISDQEEADLIHFFDNPSPFPDWKISQSGRRKQDFGPKRNFKKKKVKPADFPHMPKVFEPLFCKVSKEVSQCTASIPYSIAEVSVLEYTSENMSNFDPHIDDTWLWGDRIAGVNLLEDCVMTFVDSNGNVVDAFLPRRCLFLMSSDCRSIWMHGIRPENIKGRRVSITMRELSDEIKQDLAVAAPLLEAARSFV